MYVPFCKTIDAVADSDGGGGGAEGTFAPPLKSANKKNKCCNFIIFFHILWFKMQKFLARFARQRYLIILSIITSLKIYENDTWTYFIPSFYTAATVVNEEGKFYSKMQDF